MRKCPVCKGPVKGNAKRVYCSHLCKKRAENDKAVEPDRSGLSVIPGTVTRPDTLNERAATYWAKLAPVLIERGHLNIISEDAFAELCDLYSRVVDINLAINETNRSLLQIDDKWDNKTGAETQCFKESALSDLKRKYSKQFLDYCKAFYLTPLSNRGNFALPTPKDEEERDEFFK